MPTVPTAAGTFSPLRTFLGLDSQDYSPALLEKIVTAGASLHSFADAAFAMGLAKVPISPKHVQELTQQIGQELADRRDLKAVERRRRTLQPSVPITPEAVAVEVDGGRLRTRQPDRGRGVHDQQNKEEKVAALVSLHSQTFDTDPCPLPPPSFLNPRRVQRLVKQMEGQAADPSQSQPQQSDEAEASVGQRAEQPPRIEDEVARWSPKKRLMTCVASMSNSDSFGPLMAAEAQSRDFFAAPRRAFVADGAAYNWSIQQGYFPDFEPIVDLLHVVCYLYGAAMGVGSAGDPAGSSGWELYVRWVSACWSGKVSEVLAEMKVHQERLGRPAEGETLSKSDPRQLLSEGLSYLGNNETRMDYPRYRRAGLPTTSSLVESLVGQFNARVKSKQKFWNLPEGAECVLQVRAALLSEDGRLEQFFAQRPGCPYRRRTTAARLQQPAQTAA